MSWLIKFSILSISLLTVMASAAISPALAKISQAFPGTDKTLIKLVLTLPSLLIIPFSLLCGWLAGRMQKKHILLIGLVIYFLGGVGGAFAKTINQLLAVRAFFGIGVGLIIPLSTSLIADFFEGEERTKMMGLSGSVSHLGGVIFLLVSGWLACIGWQYAFAVYGLSMVILCMVFFWLPEPAVKKAAGAVTAKLPGGVYACALLGALMMVAFYAAPTNLAMFIESDRKMYTSEKPLFLDKEDFQAHLAQGSVSQVTRDSFKTNGIVLTGRATLAASEEGKAWVITDKGKKFTVKKEAQGLVVYTERLGRPGIAGYYLSAMTLIGVFSGVILAILMRTFGPFSGPVGIAAMAAGYWLLAGAGSLAWVLASMVCIGFSSGILMPMLLLQVAKLATGGSRAFAMAVVSVGVYFGQFISPLVLKWAGSLAGTGDMFRMQFTVLAAGLAAATIVAIAGALRQIKKHGFKVEDVSMMKHH